MNNLYTINMPEGLVEQKLTHKGGKQETVIIDVGDLEIADGFPGHWYPFVHPRTGKTYARGYYKDPKTKKVSQPLLHRLIMEPRRDINTAHLDGNTLNCTRANMKNVPIGTPVELLRVMDFSVEPMQQAVVLKDDGSICHTEVPVPTEITPARGVSFHKHKGKWEAKPYYDGKRVPLGYFPADQLAAANLAASRLAELGPEEYFNRYPKKGGRA